MVERLDIDKFYAHANARLHNAHHSQRFDLLIFSRERDPDAGVRRQRQMHARPIGLLRPRIEASRQDLPMRRERSLRLRVGWRGCAVGDPDSRSRTWTSAAKG